MFCSVLKFLTYFAYLKLQCKSFEIKNFNKILQKP